jgi:hypothetical protein
MNLSTEQLAELLAGIARAQQAVVDAIDKAQPGFRGTYLLPSLNVAANLRIPDVRLLDLPSRILLRSQGRLAMDQPTIERALAEALGLGAQTLTSLSAPAAASSPATAAFSAPQAATATATTAAAVATPPVVNLDNFFDD